MKFSTLNVFFLISFFLLILPIYYLSEISSLNSLRQISFLLCIPSSGFLAIEALRSIRKPRSWNASFLLLSAITFFVAILLILSIAFFELPFDDIAVTIVSLCYCFFSLIIGFNIQKIFESRNFLSMLIASWLYIAIMVLLKTDFSTFQVIYGSTEDRFAGAYQIVGDSLIINSILLFFRIRRDRKIGTKHQFSGGFILSCLPVFSMFLLFLNASRAAFFSFICVSGYLYLSIYSKLFKFSLKHMILLAAGAMVSFSVVFYQFGAGSTILDLSFAAGNRNLELVNSDSSTSLEARESLRSEGISSILDNPFSGRYIERSKFSGKGTYIHNILGLLQDFGSVTFAAYLMSIGISTIINFRYNYTVSAEMFGVYNALLIYEIVGLILFRYPLSFYAVFINIGMSLNNVHTKTKLFPPVQNLLINR